MNKAPLISCLCISSGEDSLLQRAVKCFAAQTYPNKELIIVSGGEDEPAEWIGTSWKGHNIKFFKSPPAINGSLRNLSIEKASGAYFCQWDDKSWHHARRLEVQLGQMEENGKLASVLPYTLAFDAMNNEAYLAFPPAQGDTVLCDRTIYELGINYEDMTSQEENEFIQRLQDINCMFPVIMPSLYLYIHQDDYSMDRQHFSARIANGRKLSPGFTKLVADIAAGNYSPGESSALLNKPGLLAELNYFDNRHAQHGAKLSNHQYEKLAGKTVLNGPFKGLKYPSFASAGSCIIAKMVGSYESELSDVVQQIIANSYERIINIGCGEGYYTNGLAVKCGQARVYAYDTDKVARDICGEMAALNGVADRVQIRSEFMHTTFDEFDLSGKCLIICDCEGFELDLFNEQTVLRLGECDLLIETHDFVNIDISTRLEKLFAATHHLTSIKSIDDYQKAKYYSFYPFEDLMDLQEKKTIYGEGRPVIMEWLWLQSKAFHGNQ